ncbi:MAG: VIT1/CCC1 family protein [Acidaminococcaceae bacterium]|nr:VIT1/CCC1 family protein [Acidaminococcaceae bacterium]MDD4721794.1 VIT1/CCC1 family protein [Acidaminococcaceae bacterium]
MKLSLDMHKRIMKFQKDEITGKILYSEIAGMMKNANNKKILMEISQAENIHYEQWKTFTGEDAEPNWLKIHSYKFLYLILGETFVIKLLEQIEQVGIKELNEIIKEIPEAQKIITQEEEHENKLIALINEEKLKYVGSMVLGLNDALVELSGTIAGMTFALASTKLVALAAIITGFAATLSMAASNYLAERANGSKTAVRSSVYTGMAYLITVVLLVLPYLILPNEFYIAAFNIMIAVVILIIWFFNFYVSVVQSTPFWPRFTEMAIISLGIAALSFAIGIIAKHILGVNIG